MFSQHTPWELSSPSCTGIQGLPCTFAFTSLPSNNEMPCAAGGNAPAQASRRAQFHWRSGARGANQNQPEPAVGSPGLSSEVPVATTQALAPSAVLWVSCSGSPEWRTLSRQRRRFFPPWPPSWRGQWPALRQPVTSWCGSRDLSFPSCPPVARTCSAGSRRAVGSGSHLNGYFLLLFVVSV